MLAAMLMLACKDIRRFRMSQIVMDLMKEYVHEIQKIYGSHLRKIILYGSYARGDYREDSDIDIMILLDISDLEIKDYFEQLVGATFDFNMAHDTDIKPIAKNEAHFEMWIVNYPFYANIHKEGVVLYGAA
jgi:predicted nucleotidyltransferase